MARYDAYMPQTQSISPTKGWVISALSGSLVVHLGLFAFFYTKRVENFGPLELPQRSEITQRVKIVQPPQKKQEEVTTAKIAETKTPKKELILPKEQIKLDEISIAPQNKPVDMAKLFSDEKPTLEMAKVETRVKAGNPDDVLPKLDDKFFTDSNRPKVVARPMSGGGPDGDGVSNAIDVANKDAGAILDALNNSAAAAPKALSLPGNTTFGYDSDQLGLDGRDAMDKVGEVFRKFLGDDLATATFTITGHTDSFGTAEYNDQLSRRRAETVKAWLVANLSIAPGNVVTAGEGSRNPVVPHTGSVEEQAPNRRVEIVIRRNRK